MEKRLKNIEDAYRWSLDTVAALREGDFSRIDMDELINEIGSIASSLRRELVAILKEVLEALLIQTYAPGHAEDVDRQLVHAQGQFQLLLYSAPSLQEAVQGAVEKAYEWARQGVIEDYGVSGIPEQCPFSLERITEDPYDRMLAAGEFE